MLESQYKHELSFNHQIEIGKLSKEIAELRIENASSAELIRQMQLDLTKKTNEITRMVEERIAILERCNKLEK